MHDIPSSLKGNPSQDSNVFSLFSYIDNMKAILSIAVVFAIFASSKAALKNEVCYEGIGCFSDERPFGNLPLPADPADIAPTWYLYQKDQEPRIITSSLGLNTQNLILFAHGFVGSFESTKEYHQPVIFNMLEIHPDADVVFVDWEKGADFGHDGLVNMYTQPASNTRVVGALIAQFLKQNPDFNAQKTYCIGFSLGAHVCGFAGKNIQGGFGRITGLDPAGPWFDKDDSAARLDKKDATFVDIVHTSWVGLQMAIGDVDFWVNDALRQPGCVVRHRRDAYFGLSRRSEWDMTEVLKEFFGCSHYRAPHVFAASISPPQGCTFDFCPCKDKDAFEDDKCNTCDASKNQQLGYPSIFNKNRGEFFGHTKSEEPFCLTEPVTTKKPWWNIG